MAGASYHNKNFNFRLTSDNFPQTIQINPPPRQKLTKLPCFLPPNHAGVPWVLPVVRKTEISIASDEAVNHEYLPVTGE